MKTPGFSRIKRFCFLRKFGNNDESADNAPGEYGIKLFGSPVFAIPLKKLQTMESEINTR